MSDKQLRAQQEMVRQRAEAQRLADQRAAQAEAKARNQARQK